MAPRGLAVATDQGRQFHHTRSRILRADFIAQEVWADGPPRHF